MTKIILVYANCVSPTGKGDFSLAGSIARDLYHLKGDEPIDIILTSTQDGTSRFSSIYGEPIDGRLDIEGSKIGLCSLDLLDAAEYHVIAFIEASRCKYAPAEILKRILAPETKFLFVETANQLPPENDIERLFKYDRYMKQQRGVYEFFDSSQLLITTCGFGEPRLGFPTLLKQAALAPISPSRFIPKTDYGFMYLAATEYSYKDYQIMGQYTHLTQLNHYVLVGQFAEQRAKIENCIESYRALPKKIHFHQSIDHVLMRKMVAGSSGVLIVSTGLMSTLEAMQDRKLPFYQDMENNTVFVASYLIALRSLLMSSTMDSSLIDLITRLSSLLFANKPLMQTQLDTTRELLASPSVCSGLINMNETLVAQASGTLSGHLWRFIGGQSQLNLESQYQRVHGTLRLAREKDSLSPDEVLRRATGLGLLFELKVIIKFILASDPSDISKNETKSPRFTALHYAVMHNRIECAKLLIMAGASLTVTDHWNQTPLERAIDKDDKKMIAMLSKALPCALSAAAEADPTKKRSF